MLPAQEHLGGRDAVSRGRNPPGDRGRLGVRAGIESSAASVSDSQDAVGELANMTGGNVKALLPMTCRLSLPRVVEGTGHTTRPPGGELVTTVAFDCQGSSLVIQLLKKRPSEET